MIKLIYKLIATSSILVSTFSLSAGAVQLADDGDLNPQPLPPIVEEGFIVGLS